MRKFHSITPWGEKSRDVHAQARNVNQRFTIHFNVTTSLLHNTAQRRKNEQHLLMNTDTLIFRQTLTTVPGFHLSLPNKYCKELPFCK